MQWAVARAVVSPECCARRPRAPMRTAATAGAGAASSHSRRWRAAALRGGRWALAGGARGGVGWGGRGPPEKERPHARPPSKVGLVTADSGVSGRGLCPLIGWRQHQNNCVTCGWGWVARAVAGARRKSGVGALPSGGGGACAWALLPPGPKVETPTVTIFTLARIHGDNGENIGDVGNVWTGRLSWATRSLNRTQF